MHKLSKKHFLLYNIQAMLQTKTLGAIVASLWSAFLSFVDSLLQAKRPAPQAGRFHLCAGDSHHKACPDTYWSIIKTSCKKSPRRAHCPTRFFSRSWLPNIRRFRPGRRPFTLFRPRLRPAFPMAGGHAWARPPCWRHPNSWKPLKMAASPGMPVFIHCLP